MKFKYKPTKTVNYLKQIQTKRKTFIIFTPNNYFY